MPKRIYDSKVFYGPAERSIDGGNGKTSIVATVTAEDKMHEFFSTEPVGKKDGFAIDKMATSMAFNPAKGQMEVMIAVAFSWIGEEMERPSQKFRPMAKEEAQRTSSVPTPRPPELPVAPSALPQRASSVPQVRQPTTPM